jgi:peptidyl-prolyl cis-trans isomerase SurA
MPYGYHIIMLHSKTNEECETSHILFLARPDENDTKTATQKMDSIRTAILENKLSFEKAVELYSTDLESKANNGYLGIFPLEQMPDENTKTIIGKLADNDYSEPFVQGGDAIQLIKLIKRYPASKYDMNADYSSVESLALRFKQNQEFQKLMTELQTTIPIELY